MTVTETKIVLQCLAGAYLLGVMPPELLKVLYHHRAVQSYTQSSSFGHSLEMNEALQ